MPNLPRIDKCPICGQINEMHLGYIINKCAFDIGRIHGVKEALAEARARKSGMLPWLEKLHDELKKEELEDPDGE